MRTSEERIREMHARASQMSQRKDKIILLRTAVSCIALALLLTASIAGSSRTGGGFLPLEYAGSTLTYGNAGGYILAAVLAFMAGAIITVLCIRWKNGKK
ncbi:MAG: hypothetical protein K5981_03390 [Clostridia bacterium]|nr:hypothetical protein [Clostridia bacterium]